MKLDLYQIDAFTSRVFSGNPAAVCPLDEWLPAETMQSIALENNLSETAFIVRAGDGRFELRWFTPTTEVDLCGHATLASAHVAWNELAESGETLTFLTRSGELAARRQGDSIAISLPRHDPVRLESFPDSLPAALGQTPGEVWSHGPEEKRSYVAIFSSETDVRRLDPDFRELRTLAGSVAMATAPGESCAFVSRFFAPCYGIDEDPVTGSSYCVLGPYWSRVLGRDRMPARQVSPRGGEVDVDVQADRVWVGGRTVKFLEATVSI